MENGGKKLKILYIITKGNFGGAQRYVFDLATNIPKDIFEPIVAIGGSGILKDKLELAGIQTLAIPDLERDISFIKEIRAFINIFKTIKEIAPDIVHLNSSKAGALGSLASRFYNLSLKLETFNFQLSTCKVLFTAHGFPFKEKRKFLQRKILEYASWFTIFCSHTTIVVSRDDRERAEKFVFVQSKIKLIHNGIAVPKFKTRTEARKIIAEKIGCQIAENQLWIGSVAELHKNKGLEYAISGIAKIFSEKPLASEFVYIIIGGGEERENLETLIKQEKLEDKVFLAGEYNGASELLKAFDIFLLPSLKEGLPYALLEAGVAGLPTVATNVGGVRDVMDDMKSGIIVKEKRPKEIADAVRYLSEHEDKRKEFGEQLAKKVETEFRLERMVKETVAVYKNC